MDFLFGQFPIIRTAGLELRQVTSADVSAVFTIFSDPEVVRFYDLDTFEYHDQVAAMIARWQRRFENRQAIRWGITQVGQGKVIGTVGLHVESEWKAGLGYDLGSAHWRKGIMTQALKAVIEFVFEQVEVERLEALVIPGNVASERLLDKLGFVNEGLLRHYAYFKGSHQDLTCFSLLRSDTAEQ